MSLWSQASGAASDLTARALPRQAPPGLRCAARERPSLLSAWRPHVRLPPRLQTARPEDQAKGPSGADAAGERGGGGEPRAEDSIPLTCMSSNSQWASH